MCKTEKKATTHWQNHVGPIKEANKTEGSTLWRR